MGVSQQTKERSVIAMLGTTLGLILSAGLVYNMYDEGIMTETEHDTSLAQHIVNMETRFEQHSTEGHILAFEDIKQYAEEGQNLNRCLLLSDQIGRMRDRIWDLEQAQASAQYLRDKQKQLNNLIRTYQKYKCGDVL